MKDPDDGLVRPQHDYQWPDHEGTIEQVIERVVREVAELPDRTSPEDWPAAMLVTSEELAAVIATHLRTLLAERDRLQGLVKEVLDYTKPPDNFDRVDDLGCWLAETGWYKRATPPRNDSP